MNFNDMRKLCRKLRKNQTPQEKSLWQHLSYRKLDGKKFLRQHPLIYDSDRSNIRFFIADFYCHEVRLVIELDGKHHDFNKEYDEWRDDIIESKGIKVLRIRNSELENMKNVLKKIRAYF
tara:strand:- start:241 stop:600 length:360 start_codon:yes stop_codon:yes gene_type:complete